jgi:peptidoglycan/xylan/chitin deacetylase (PgdA/CDA1 family)
MGKLKFIKNKKILSSFLLCLTAVISAILIISMPVTAIIGASNTNGAIYKGNEKGNKIALTFNVYENAKNVEKILDILSIEKQKATFFIGGCWADDNEVLLVEMANKGYEIGNHGYFHKDHAKLDYNKNKDEIFLTESVIQAFCGEKTTLFAPPSGSFSGDTALACADLGYKMIMWSKDTIDWRDSDSELVFSRATKNLQNGDLILMHPKEHTLKALPKILDFYNSQGFSVVTVSENIEGAV